MFGTFMMCVFFVFELFLEVRVIGLLQCCGVFVNKM
jgi:hypothetical protein